MFAVSVLAHDLATQWILCVGQPKYLAKRQKGTWILIYQIYSSATGNQAKRLTN